MNIFYLSADPEQAAQWHVDRHVVKMPLEYAQLLSTAHAVLDGNVVGYKPTHKNHPSASWARFSMSTYMWLYCLFAATATEYKFRYSRTHKSYEDLADVLKHPPKNIPERDFVPPFLAMPADYVVWDMDTVRPDALLSYRSYYVSGKRDLHCWSFRDPPPWINGWEKPHHEDQSRSSL